MEPGQWKYVVYGVSVIGTENFNVYVIIQLYINVIVRLNSLQIDNCTQLSNTFEIDGRELSIKKLKMYHPTHK